MAPSRTSSDSCVLVLIIAFIIVIQQGQAHRGQLCEPRRGWSRTQLPAAEVNQAGLSPSSSCSCSRQPWPSSCSVTPGEGHRYQAAVLQRSQQDRSSSQDWRERWLRRLFLAPLWSSRISHGGHIQAGGSGGDPAEEWRWATAGGPTVKYLDQLRSDHPARRIVHGLIALTRIMSHCSPRRY